MLFGNEADIAINDYTNNVQYTTEAWTSYIFDHNNLNKLAEEISNHIDEERIINVATEITV